MEWFLIYLFVMIERIGSFLMLFWFPFWVSVIALVILFIGCGLQEGSYGDNRSLKEIWTDETATLVKRFCKWVIPISFLFGVLGFLLPSQKDAAIIVGSGITYNVITSETGKRLGGKAVELLEQKIDSALGSKEPEKKSEK
jgi:hypothetical protein